MKKWMQKFLNQFGLDSPAGQLTEERATIIYMIDTYNRHLIELDSSPVRKVREILDEFSKELIHADDEKIEKVLFRFRQYFASYRIEEYSYIQKTFDDFRGIIWDFVDQLAEDFCNGRKEDLVMQKSLEDLRETVEANSIEVLKTQAREFIDKYVELQSRKEKRKIQHVDRIKKNLDTVKRKLNEVAEAVNIDHLTKAFNRKAFDEQIKKQRNLVEISRKPASLVMIDIDHFKKINDSYGHTIGDFVIQQCVNTTVKLFNRDSDFVARIGGEEFAILLPETTSRQAAERAERLLQEIRREAFVQDGHMIRFTISIGIAQTQAQESVEGWIKRADAALYDSKTNGRNRLTVSGLSSLREEVA
ncbi:MAG: GGDEF domain-containing protein [Bdellovibrio sp.]|nr:MAG: GGDEF domain-containing protein [Bdellovibrio sp.]